MALPQGKSIALANSATVEALRAKLALIGGVAGSFTSALPTGTISTDRVYQYAGADNTTIGGIAWRNGDSALYNGATWTRIPFQALTNYATKIDVDRRSAIKFRDEIKIGYYYDYSILRESAAANFSYILLTVKKGDVVKNELFEPEKQHHTGNNVNYNLNGVSITSTVIEGLVTIPSDGLLEIRIYSQAVGDFPNNDNLDNFFILVNQNFIERNSKIENIFTDGNGKYLATKIQANTSVGALNSSGLNDDGWPAYKRTDYLTNCTIEFDSLPNWAGTLVLCNLVLYRKNADNSYTYIKGYRSKRLHSILVVPAGFYVRVVTFADSNIYVGNANDLVSIFPVEKSIPIGLSSIIKLSKVYYVNDNIIGVNNGYSVAAIEIKSGDNLTNERFNVDPLLGCVTNSFFIKTGDALGVVITDLMVNGNYLFPNDGVLYINFYRSDRLWLLSDFVGYWIYKEKDFVTYKTFKKNTSSKSKKVLWLGTSIPASGTYPQSVCEKLGHKLYKLAYGGSCITKQINLSLSATIAELTAEFGADAAQFSYENRIIPYINGVIATCDTIVFEHGYNDTTAIRNVDLITPSTIDSEIDWSSIDRTKFIGAFNFLRNKILETKKDVNIIIVSHLENRSNQVDFGGHHGALVCRAQQLIAEHYNLPFIDVHNFLGWPKVTAMPNTSTFVADWNTANGTAHFNYWTDGVGNISVFQYYCPDGIHPSSDNRGIAMERLTNVYAKLLGGII